MRRKNRPSALFSAAAKGSIWTRLSFLVMGAGCVRYKQYARGLIYVLTEIGFFYFFGSFALPYLSKLNTLGTEAQKKVWNEELQIFQRFPGDNSMLILLYSVLSLAVVIVFLYIWYSNIRDSWNAQQCTEQGRLVAGFRDDLKSLAHERFHVTLLAMPMLTLVLFTLLPIIFMILIAFTNFDADHQPPGNLFTWVGMTNVTDIFLGNEIKTHTFFGLLGWTIVWAILATFTNYILGMLLAVAINNKMVKLKQVWRTCFIIAIAIPQFVSLLLISRALEPAGAVNVLLQKLGLISQPLPFLLDPTLARIVVVVVNMWIGIPYTMMTFSGVLMNIPAELYESAEIDGAGPIKKFTSITLPYIREFHIDGWRLDVANELDDGFLRAFRTAVKGANPDALIVGEVWENAAHYLNGDMLDCAMNYDFRRYCRRFFAEETVGAEVFDANISTLLLRYRENALYAQLNLLDSHDVSRYLTLCGENTDKMELSVLLQMTFPGMPCVFYGDEKGLCGTAEREYRQAMAWAKTHPLEEIYRRLIALRKAHPALRYGSFRTNSASDKVYSYSRAWKDQVITVTMNLGDAPIRASSRGRLLLKKGEKHGIIGAWEYEVREEQRNGGDDL